MQVFNACFKVIRRNLPALLTYLFIFVFLVIMLTLFFRNPGDAVFEPVKPRIAVFQDDQGDPYAERLVSWLGQQARIIPLPDETEAIQDALFYRDVTYVLRIPAGFGARLMAGDLDGLALERTLSMDGWSGTAMDLLVERYLRLSRLYVQTLDSWSADMVSDAVQADVTAEAAVQLNAGEKKGINRAAYFFIYLAYSMMAVMVLGITSILLVFNQPDLRRRNLSAPVRLVRFNLQLMLACLVFALLTWLLMVLISLLLGARELPVMEFVLLAANALVFTLACLSLSFLISQLIRSRAVQQSIANVLALGTCFISGVFVPQELLGDTVQTLASFTPTYWYVRAVNTLDNLPVMDLQALQPVIQAMLIQLGFAVALLAVALAVVRQKRQAQAM
ncbi:MAG: ABC transporter permease [Clostridiaceae bacterium]|nr:ABC transporter permease [Clostridiaceae bacterium]